MLIGKVKTSTGHTYEIWAQKNQYIEVVKDGDPRAVGRISMSELLEVLRDHTFSLLPQQEGHHET